MKLSTYLCFFTISWLIEVYSYSSLVFVRIPSQSQMHSRSMQWSLTSATSRFTQYKVNFDWFVFIKQLSWLDTALQRHFPSDFPLVQEAGSGKHSAISRIVPNRNRREKLFLLLSINNFLESLCYSNRRSDKNFEALWMTNIPLSDLSTLDAGLTFQPNDYVTSLTNPISCIHKISSLLLASRFRPQKLSLYSLW